MAVNHREGKTLQPIEEGLKTGDERGFPSTLLKGEYNEEESVRSFQEALRQWREERSEEKSKEATWTQSDGDTLTVAQPGYTGSYK